MPTRLLLAAVLLAPLVLATPAHALRCREWAPLVGEQRTAALRAGYQSILSSNQAKRWEINISRVEQCLIRSESSIMVDFDEACRRGKQVRVDALDRILMEYVRTCVN
jgi:hypothetical protein